jgi:hypothetical protein
MGGFSEPTLARVVPLRDSFKVKKRKLLHPNGAAASTPPNSRPGFLAENLLKCPLPTSLAAQPSKVENHFKRPPGLSTCIKRKKKVILTKK